MSINVSNPFKKIDVEDVYIVHPVTVHTSYDDIEQVDARDREILLGRKSSKDVIVNKEMRMIITDKNDYNYNSFGSMKGTDIKTNKEVYINDRYWLESSFKGEMELPLKKQTYEPFSETNNYITYPIKLTEVAEVLHIKLKNQMSVNELNKLLNELNSKELDKEPVLLSTDKLQASFQLSNILGIKTEKLFENNAVKEPINKIMDLCKNNQNVYLEYVKKQLEEIINNYEKEYKENKPTLDIKEEDKINLKITKIDPGTQLKIDLERLFNSLSTEINLVSYLDELYKCKRIIIDTDNNKEIKTQLENNVLTIVNETKYLKEEDRNNKINTIQEKIEKEIEEVTKELSKHSKEKPKNEEINLQINKKTLKQEIQELKDQYLLETNKYKNYVILRDALEEKQSFDYYKGNQIDDITKSTLFVIDHIENENIKKEMHNKYNTITNKYIDKINNAIQNKDQLSEENYKNIETELREELQPLIQQLDNIFHKSLNQIFSSESINIQLQNSLDFIKNPNEEEHSKEPITSMSIDIYKEIQDNEEKKAELTALLNQIQESLKDKKIDNYQEYNKERQEVLKQLASYQFKILSKKKEIEEYEKRQVKI